MQQAHHEIMKIISIIIHNVAMTSAHLIVADEVEQDLTTMLTDKTSRAGTAASNKLTYRVAFLAIIIL
jgi:hypothetical protein